MNKRSIQVLGVLMVLTLSVSVLHFSYGQQGSTVVARVEPTDTNTKKPINVSSDKTQIFEEKYNTRDMKDVFISEMGLTVLQILVVIAFTMIYIDANKARIRMKDLHNA